MQSRVKKQNIAAALFLAFTALSLGAATFGNGPYLKGQRMERSGSHILRRVHADRDERAGRNRGGGSQQRPTNVPVARGDYFIFRRIFGRPTTTRCALPMRDTRGLGRSLPRGVSPRWEGWME